MLNGAEIPFRRSRHARATGSLIFDRQHEERLRETRDGGPSEPMRIWEKGHFVQA
ncbi:hypothetical protein WSK_0507 [Novosphingobium sp. Rr 2-17]|uniref:hypothetical protein n=1 Tax=Novosphingobium sp. Rr 2-17 TaxID=555793 RepID=UPI0002699E66|nr:hypothetical protein [Novosphingobium sp. Rr 2-17]EIZ80825.1 hypothetical protein WSK_0507 [Novosphingobium sp. Rr 2-17]